MMITVIVIITITITIHSISFHFSLFQHGSLASANDFSSASPCTHKKEKKITYKIYTLHNKTHYKLNSTTIKEERI